MVLGIVPGTKSPPPRTKLIMTQRTYPEAVQNCVRRCRRVARTALVVVTVFWIIFALLKGFQNEGGIIQSKFSEH